MGPCSQRVPDRAPPERLVAHAAPDGRLRARTGPPRARARPGDLAGGGLALEDRIELAIVISGIRRDLGQTDAALFALQIPQLKSTARKPWSARLAYAYADALLASGDEGGARDWFARAADFDDDAETDAADRLAELDGIVMTDLLEGEPDSDEDEFQD